MGYLRSQSMSRGTLVLPAESDLAKSFVDDLGRHTNLQILDMNETSLLRPFRRSIQRVEEIERQLRYLQDQVTRWRGQIQKGEVGEFLLNDEDYSVDKIETSVKSLYRKFSESDQMNEEMTREIDLAAEEIAVLELAMVVLSGTAGPGLRQRSMSLQSLGSTSMLDDETQQTTGRGLTATLLGGASVGTISGVLPMSEQEKFGRIVFRVSRGNSYVTFAPVEPVIGDEPKSLADRKAVFAIYFQGGLDGSLGLKLQKVCRAFLVSLHGWPKSVEDAADRMRVLRERLDDRKEARRAFEMHIHREVGSLVRPPRSEASSLLEEWRRFIAKEKAVVAMLNRFEGDVTLRAGCWFPTAELETIQQRLALQASRLHASAFLASDGKPITHATGGDADPPSFIKRNEFTWAFQELVDTYGTCRYQEANPGVLTCVTFPFLFGIMYGDIGHGSILLAFGIYLMLNSKSLKQQGGAMADMAAARYMLTMMGAFAVYAGFMYNEFMAIGINLFGSQWTTDPKNPEDMFRKGGPYVFGLDPAWKGATNELVFLNSFKMKFSVIVGVAQMTVGVFLKGGNTLHARSVLDFVFEFLPQITFMTCLFGYMDFLIVYKWLQSTDDPNAKFPALIQSMINMVLVKPVDPENQLIPNQGAIQSWLLLAAVCAVPIMLFPKPIILLIAHSVKQRGERGGGRREPRGEGDEGGGAYHRLEEGAAGGGARVHPEAPSAASGGPRGGAVGAHVTAHGGEGGEVVGGEHGEEGEEFEFGEIFIHQVIETIEFVLGTVSNTASYLRLWALSLAHQQLSLVFFDKCVGAAMSMPDSILKPLAIYVAFAIFMAITFGVLLCMDVLECFLHALRLQWVEFQNKFFKADGHPFSPFKLETVLTKSDSAD